MAPDFGRYAPDLARSIRRSMSCCRIRGPDPAQRYLGVCAGHPDALLQISGHLGTDAELGPRLGCAIEVFDVERPKLLQGHLDCLSHDIGLVGLRLRHYGSGASSWNEAKASQPSTASGSCVAAIESRWVQLGIAAPCRRSTGRRQGPRPGLAHARQRVADVRAVRIQQALAQRQERGSAEDERQPE